MNAGNMGKASGVNSSLQRFGSAFGVAIATTVFASNGSLTSPDAVASGFRPALMSLAVLALIGAVTSLAVGKPGAPAAALSSAEPALAGA